MMEMGTAIDFAKLREDQRKYGQAQLDDAKGLAAALQIEVETRIHDLDGGRVADAILQEAKDSACDLIVIGTHGRRGLSRALLGSDAEQVLRQSPVPVLLVRAPNVL